MDIDAWLLHLFVLVLLAPFLVKYVCLCYVQVLFNRSSISVWVNGAAVSQSKVQAEIPLDAEVMFLGDIAHQRNRTRREVDAGALTPFKGSLQDIRVSYICFRIVINIPYVLLLVPKYSGMFRRSFIA